MSGTTKYRNTSESYYDDGGSQKADVVELDSYRAHSFGRQVNDAISYQDNIGRGAELEPPRIGKKSRDRVSFGQIRKKADQKIIDYAYHLIVETLDNEIDRIERSNLFDEWKDTLETLIAEVSNVSVNHRKILGVILVATKAKDISDFTIEELKILKDATYMLRQLRVTRSDSKRIIMTLICIGADLAIPLAVNGMSDKEEKSLDKLMKSLVEKSKYL